MREISAVAGTLSKLRRDVRGNTIAIMAAMLIPLAAFSGSAIDVARLYVVKVRLQQACDAGALAGRKFMTDTSSTTPLDSAAATQANNFFANNFHSGFFQSTAVTFTPSKTADSQVAGVATATVPMAVMGMFGMKPLAISVTCQARFDVADADIMFVLDTTGSMACLTSDSTSTCNSYDGGNVVQNSDGSYSVTEKSNSRIAGLRSAVLSFFDTVTGEADPTTNFRFGFVPFSTTTNVGKLLQPLGYLVNSWTYQSREVAGDANSGSATSSSVTEASSACAVGTTRSPATAKTYNSNGTAKVTTVSYANGSCTTSQQTVVPNWLYKPETFDVSGYAAGAGVVNPAQVGGATSGAWPGCIEERQTTAGATNFSTTSPPLDLDVDTVPTADNSRWKPMWPDVEFARLSTNETSSAARTVTARPVSSSQMYEGYTTLTEEVACPAAASRLSSMQLPGSSSSSAKTALRNQIQTYLSASSGFRPYGTTYLDAGILWGTRLLSPSGMFASDTAAWAGHNAPNRYLIFLTDGTMETDTYAYSAHGIEYYDQRVSGSTPSEPQLDNYHYDRFAAACAIAKNHNITVFVISYAQSTVPSQLSACASPGQAYAASDSTALQTAFNSIAQQVAMLRLSK